MKRRTSALLTLAVTALGGSAPSAAQDYSNLRALSIITGTCNRLIIAGRDLSRGCDGRVVNTAYRTGRIGFVFMVRDLAVVTISGTIASSESEVAEIRVDRIFLTLTGTETPPSDFSADGRCQYANPNRGRAFLRCSGTTGREQFTADFMTDGSPPSFQEF